jgi:hypothetical protein
MPDGPIPKGKLILVALAFGGIALGLVRLTGDTAGPLLPEPEPSLAQEAATVGPKEPGRLRVLVLGAANGARGAGERWTEGFEARVSEAGYAMELLDFGRPGQSLRGSLETLVTHGERLQPDLVLVTMSLRDDLLLYEQEVDREQEAAPEVESERAMSPSRFSDLLSVHSTSAVPFALERFEGDLERVNERCTALKARCVWIALPVALQVHERHHAAFARQGYDVASWMTASTPLAARLRTTFLARGLALVDPLPALRALASERLLFDDDDARLSAAGHLAVGYHVYEHLEGQGVLASASAAPPSDPRLAQLLAGTVPSDASDEERALVEKIGAHRALREELQAVLKALPEQRAAAEELQERIRKVEKGLPPEVVKEVLAAADETLKQRGHGRGTLLGQARGIDERLGALMAKEALAPDDSPSVRRLKLELQKQQQSTAALGTGAAVAFRALRLMEQMKIALPELEKQQKGNGPSNGQLAR